MGLPFLGGYDGPMTQACEAKSLVASRPRTLREEIQDRIAHHKASIADLESALDALTPDVEKALNALQKIR